MTHHSLYWLGTGWWYLDLVHALLLYMSKTCPLCLPWSRGSSAHSTAHPWLFMAWAIFWFLILYGLLPFRAGLCLIVCSSSFSLLSHSFRGLAPISYRTTLSFLLWCYLTPAYWASLGLLLILLLMTQYDHLGFVLHCLWAILSHLFPLRHPWSTSFPWASLALFLTLHSHELLLTHLGFLGPITLSFILGAHGLAISPLLSLLALLWACCDSFSLFYITYCRWVCYFSLSELLQARLLPQGPFVYFMGP